MDEYHDDQNQATRRPRRKHDETLQKLVGSRIRDERLSKDVALETLEQMTDFNKGQLSLIERGKVNLLVNSANRLCRGLDVPLGRVFIDEETIQKARDFWADGSEQAIDDETATFYAIVLVYTMPAEALPALRATAEQLTPRVEPERPRCRKLYKQDGVMVECGKVKGHSGTHCGSVRHG